MFISVSSWGCLQEIIVQNYDLCGNCSRNYLHEQNSKINAQQKKCATERMSTERVNEYVPGFL